MKIPVLLATVAVAIASPLSAGTLMFSGSFANTNAPAAPGGRCPSLTVTIGNHSPFYATGLSTLGAFTSIQSHCLDSGPPIAVGAADTPYYDGRFTYSFTGGGSLFGTYSGVLSNSGVASVIENVQSFLVTGGSGKFAHARGTFVGTGDIRFLGGPPTASLTIGESVLAVPEPATWGMLIIGFTATGLAIRARRSHVPLQSAT
ncbi:PEPxxWA-CTERM sorting domain-containing protein [Polymorphobacter sp. PAMC 29334]|uniref:PEPxxWA-CTERM sorting domain-containing protein n=1 Tax=Polymorphobacter sp. PAMC 29334 TaxID=2862331 RepID=UPI001C7686CE|nr:PEPxxWA-CTERM sorting domain-containing protein [Polymorphobacter sp. PAMC 29334]QYE33821.1 PEPxxWA-CTERM sorting domain-containing protein [Polymorphobacter sp. PAMC 29334]